MSEMAPCWRVSEAWNSSRSMVRRKDEEDEEVVVGMEVAVWSLQLWEAWSNE